MTHADWLQTLAEVGRPESAGPTYYLGAIFGILGISAVNFAGFVFAINNDAPAKGD